MRVALIISGMLRNYDAALLSLPIWGDCDRYLVTWQSAGNEMIEDYCAKAEIKEKLIVDERVMDIFAPNFKFNWLRMMYLWHRALMWIPDIYDKYILIRPDGFYWLEDAGNMSKIISQCSSIATHGANQNTSIATASVGDQIVIVNSTRKHVIEKSFRDIIPLFLEKYLSGQIIDIHAMLFELLQSDLNVADSNNVGQVDSVLVRDTFKKIDSDIYNYELYEAIFHDTAAWWRNQYGSNLGRSLRP